MHHPTLHRDDDVLHSVPEAGLLEAVDAASRECKIDGPPGAESHPAHIRSPLEYVNFVSALPQQNGKKWTVQSRANQRDSIGFRVHATFDNA